MSVNIVKSMKQWSGVIIAIISYYLVHEGTHLLLALLYGVYEKIRFVGIWGIQIVITDESLEGIRLALFSGLSSIVTISMGYILAALSPYLYKINNRGILIALYYITLCFMVLDPAYISVLSFFIGGGGDLNGITTGLHTSDIPFRIVFGSIAIINVILFKNKVSREYDKIFKVSKS